MRLIRRRPVRIGAPAPASRSAREAAAVIGGPALRCVLRGEETLARAIVGDYDDEAIDALTAAADRLGAVCREITGRRS